MKTNETNLLNIMSLYVNSTPEIREHVEHVLTTQKLEMLPEMKVIRLKDAAKLYKIAIGTLRAAGLSGKLKIHRPNGGQGMMWTTFEAMDAYIAGREGLSICPQTGAGRKK